MHDVHLAQEAAVAVVVARFSYVFEELKQDTGSASRHEMTQMFFLQVHLLDLCFGSFNRE